MPYDWIDRLVSALGDYGLRTYSYDPVGNRLSLNDVTCIYNDMNQLLSISDGTTLTYDDMGNTLTKTDSTNTWTYTYDTQNRLTHVEKNQELIAEYEYDGSSKRIQKTEWIESIQNYQTLVYMYSDSNVIYEKNPGTGQEATYVYGPTGRIAKIVDGLRDYYHTDHLGSSRLITDESGNVLTDVEYEPFGTPRGEYEERYLYTGKERDATGLTYFGARYYDGETGRFLTRDPVTGETHIPQSLNRYVYCLNNPLRYTDPLGLSKKESYGYHIPRFDWEKMKKLWDAFTDILELVRSGLLTLKDAIMFVLNGVISKMVARQKATGIFDYNDIYYLMSLIEMIVVFLGDDLGIDGGFICIEGMGDLLFYMGKEYGACLMFHPDTGWGLFTYKGSVCGMMLAGGVSIIVGFFTWHNAREFSFTDWEGLFEGTVVTGGISFLSGTIVKFNNPNSSITGWCFGWGFGIGNGIARFDATYKRAPNWLIPSWLWGIVVPQGK